MQKKYDLQKKQFIEKYEDNFEHKAKKYYKNQKNENNPNLFSLNINSSFPSIKIGENRKNRFMKENYYSLKNYNSKNKEIIKKRNYITPSFKEKIVYKDNISNFIRKKDPKEVIYKSPSLIENSYNNINNNIFKSIKNEDHVKDILNYGNREYLYNYVAKKGFLYKNNLPDIRNKNLERIIKEKISKDEDKEYYIQNPWSVLEYSYKEEANFNNRKAMEDKAKSVDCFNNDSDCGLFCIFDGHGGIEVSTFLQKNIISYMKDYSLNFDILFKRLDENFRNENFNTIGSTACIVYITKEYYTKILYCVNIGDTRCILINKDGFKRISYDDRADDENEINRIKKEGGIVFGGRVYGSLMLTRTFGDNEYKKYGVICKPHINKIEIDSNNKYIIIASDGVWDVMNENEAYNISKQCKNSKELCDIIIKISLDKGSTDNISCFAIKLN